MRELDRPLSKDSAGAATPGPPALGEAEGVAVSRQASALDSVAAGIAPATAAAAEMRMLGLHGTRTLRAFAEGPEPRAIARFVTSR